MEKNLYKQKKVKNEIKLIKEVIKILAGVGLRVGRLWAREQGGGRCSRTCKCSLTLNMYMDTVRGNDQRCVQNVAGWTFECRRCLAS